MVARLTISAHVCRPEDLTAAADWIRAGGLVVYPTDTYYAVAADPTSASAIADVFDWKGRGAAAALPLIAGSVDQVNAWFGPIDIQSAALAERFWPGPMSLVLAAGTRVAGSLHAGIGTVAVRVPAHRIARALAAAWGGPLPSTSANRTGAPAVSNVEQLAELALDERLFVIDGGPTPGGPPSTIVDARTRPPTLVREGAVAWSRVLEFIDK